MFKTKILSVPEFLWKPLRRWLAQQIYVGQIMLETESAYPGVPSHIWYWVTIYYERVSYTLVLCQQYCNGSDNCLNLEKTHQNFYPNFLFCIVPIFSGDRGIHRYWLHYVCVHWLISVDCFISKFLPGE